VIHPTWESGLPPLFLEGPDVLRSALVSITARWLNLSSRHMHVPRRAVEHVINERAGSPNKFGSDECRWRTCLLSGVSRVRSSPPLVPNPNWVGAPAFRKALHEGHILQWQVLLNSAFSRNRAVTVGKKKEMRLLTCDPAIEIAGRQRRDGKPSSEPAGSTRMSSSWDVRKPYFGTESRRPASWPASPRRTRPDPHDLRAGRLHLRRSARRSRRLPAQATATRGADRRRAHDRRRWR
jgi:hypothetical protein